MRRDIVADSTVRQRIMKALEGRFLTAKELSGELGVREKEILENLEHVFVSLGRGRAGARFKVRPSACLECGFVFKKRERLKTPGKCPVCKSEEITETKYGIVREGGVGD